MKKTTRTMSAAAATAALAIGGIVLGGPAAMASDGTSSVSSLGSSSWSAPASTSTSSPALINGPLISGPLLDVGGVLNSLQIGQFQ